MKEGDVLYTGKIVTKQFAEVYNRLSDEITTKEKAGMNVESLLNGRHYLFVTYAETK